SLSGRRASAVIRQRSRPLSSRERSNRTTCHSAPGANSLSAVGTRSPVFAASSPLSTFWTTAVMRADLVSTQPSVLSCSTISSFGRGASAIAGEDASVAASSIVAGSVNRISALLSVWGRSEVQVGIVGGRSQPRNAVAQQRPEARPRFDSLVPELGRSVLVPRYVVEIVEHREMGRGRDVGKRECIPREPVAALGQPPDVVEVIPDVDL